MSSTSNNQPLPIDFSKLTFSAPIREDVDSEEETDYDDEHAFLKEYTFTIEDPNPPPPPVEEEQDPQDLSLFASIRRFKYTPPPEPLVTILVRTVDRKLIPPGEFYIYMDEVCEDFLQFSMTVFNKNGRIKPSLYQPKSPQRGTGVWGQEINHGTFAYIETIRVNPKYRRQGLGRWAVENLLKSDVLAHCPFFFLWATSLNERSPFEGPDPEFESKKQGVISFWRSVGFRRIAGTWFFGYARNPEHRMRSLRAEDDAGEAPAKGFSLFDAHEASFTTIHG